MTNSNKDSERVLMEGATEPTFKKPDKQKQQDADPHADQRAYFAYWEAKRIEDAKNRRRDYGSLNVYERARLKYRS